MSQDIFFTELNEFSRKYFLKSDLTLEDTLKFQERVKDLRSLIFEQLMLFEKITFKVWGESVLIPVLINIILGEKTFDALMEQKALSFVLWRPNVLYTVNNIPGLNVLAAGNFSSPAHADPMTSIELGLRAFDPPLEYRKKKHLKKKLLRVYGIPDSDLPNRAVNGVNQAARDGLLSTYGITPQNLDSLSAQDKAILSKCAEDLLEYQYLTQEGKTSFSEYKFFSPFWASIERFKTVRDIGNGFGDLSKIENMPNLRELFVRLPDPMASLPKLRGSSNATKFREWLETTAGGSLAPDFPKEYVNAIAERNGFFERAPGKLTKSIVMAVAGGGVGHLLGGPIGAVVGAGTATIAAEKLTDVAAELGLHLFDSFLLERILRGWSPRLFFGDIERVLAKSDRTSAGK